ncbi:MAG: TIM44-like domain-containing protein [Thermodesulfobacteriota bacterium]
MPGARVIRRVILVKVCLAILLLAFCPALLAGEGSEVGGLSGFSQLQVSASPAMAAQWSPRRSPYTPADAQPSKKPGYPSGGFLGLLKFLAGGLLGGLLCSFLFGCPLSLFWGQEGWPLGFLDVAVITAAAYLGYRLLRPASYAAEDIPLPGFSMPGATGPPVFTIQNEAGPGLAQVSHNDPTFKLPVFVGLARQMIFDLHNAWNHEDLDRIKDRITPQMLEFLGMGIKLLGFRGEISRVEDLALNRIVVVMAGEKEGRERIAVSFQGQVVDYLLERRSFKLISGSMAYPERLHECWIFERQVGRGPWLLADIQDSRFFSEHEAA